MAVKPILLPLGMALLAMLGGAARTGLLVPNAEAALSKRRENEDATDVPLLLTPSDDDVGAGLIGHRSHSSHRSHRSHSSHYSGSSGRSRGYTGDYVGDASPVYEPPPPPPKPAVVSFVALPGGRIFVDGKLLGVDATPPVALKAGSHSVRVDNRFLDRGTIEVVLEEGQTGVVNLQW